MSRPIGSILAITRPSSGSRSTGAAHSIHALHAIRLEIECLVQNLIAILILSWHVMKAVALVGLGGLTKFVGMRVGMRVALAC